jgi:glycerophosphoryl diester phosphodiesterase
MGRGCEAAQRHSVIIAMHGRSHYEYARCNALDRDRFRMTHFTGLLRKRYIMAAIGVFAAAAAYGHGVVKEFVARHENDITETTNVATHSDFATRKTTKTIDGEKHVGWFTEDFTLAELKTLRAKERLPLLRPDNAKYDGQFEVPTLAEIITLAKSHSVGGRVVGIYPETKHPSYFASIGHPMEAHLVHELKAAGWDSADAPVFIQSFEVNNLKALHKMTRIRLIQLMDKKSAPADNAVPSYPAMTTPEGFKAVAAYAYGVGPNKDMVDAAFVANAHAAGLRVHPWTFRAENFFLPPPLWSGVNPRAHGRLSDEIRRYLDLGIDGFFTDFTAIGVEARAASRSGE